MKWLASLVVILGLMGCATGGTHTAPITLPDLDGGEFYDTPYMEGWDQLRAGKPRAAMDLFEQSNVSDDKLYVAFGYTFLLQNKLQLAKRNFERALVANPNNIPAELGIATVYERMKDIANAFRTYAHLRAKYPENAWVKIRYEYIRSTQTEYYLREAERFKTEDLTEDYIRALEMAEKYSDDIVDIKVKIGKFYFEKNELEKSTAYFEKVSELQPHREDILRWLGESYERMEKYDAAIVVYKRISDLRPGDEEVENKINDLKVKFYDLNLPTKFKNIFFKYNLNREDLAALIGHYFARFLEPVTTPLIITDIGGSFAKEQIITLCTLGILKIRPDHRFQRYTEISRASLAVVFDSLIRYLKRVGYSFNVSPLDSVVEPVDMSPLHKHYGLIKFLVNARILPLDEENRFNPTAKVAPSDVLVSLRRIINSIED